MELRGNDGNVELRKVEVKMEQYFIDEIMDGVMDGIIDEEEIKIEKLSTDEEKQKAAEKIVDGFLKYNIERVIERYLYEDIDVMEYMTIKYIHSGKYNMNEKTRNFYDTILIPEEDRSNNDKKKLKESTLKYFPFEMKKEGMTKFCKKSQEILFSSKHFDIFDIEKDYEDSEDITKYGFYKTKEIIDKIEKECSEDIRIQNILLMDYILGIRLTNLIQLGTKKIVEKETIEKILNVMEILVKIPCLRIRKELAIEIMLYIRKQKNQGNGINDYRCYDEEYIKENLENKEGELLYGRSFAYDNIVIAEVEEVIDERIEKVKKILKKLVDNLKEWCLKITNKEINTILLKEDSVEDSVKEVENCAKKRAVSYIKNEFRPSMWECYIDFYCQRGYEKLIGRVNELSDQEIMDWGYKRDNINPMFVKKYSELYIMYTKKQKGKVARNYVKKQGNDIKVIRDYVKKQQEGIKKIKSYIEKQRENIKNIEESYENENEFLTKRIKMRKTQINDVQKYAFIHKYMVKGINLDFEKIK